MSIHKTRVCLCFDYCSSETSIGQSHLDFSIWKVLKGHLSYWPNRYYR